MDLRGGRGGGQDGGPGTATLGSAMAALDALIEELERSYREAETRMSDPAVYSDHREAEEVGRRLKKLEGPYKLAQARRQAAAKSHLVDKIKRFFSVETVT